MLDFLRGFRWIRVLLDLGRTRRVEGEMEREFADYLARRSDELIASGVDATAARRQARVEFGGVEQVKERVRGARAGEALRTFGSDARFAWRLLRRAPGFAAVAVLTLGLGIGGTTALFSVVQAVLLRPLPYPQGERLVHIWAAWPGGAGNLSFPDFVALREETATFESLAAYEPWGGVALTGVETPVPVNPNFVSAEYLEMLGPSTAIGRTLRFPNGDAGMGEGGGREVLLSHAFWQRQFAGDAAVVGRAVNLNGLPFTVVGVLAAGFRDLGLAEGGPETDLWLASAAAVPLIGQAPLTDVTRIYWGLGRLRPGITQKQAQERVAAVAERMARERPGTHVGYLLRVQTLDERLHGPYARPSTLVLLGTGCLLLVACTNLAGALANRLAHRGGELAMRAALGASGPRLVRQLLTEAALIAVLGGIAGLAVAFALTRWLALWVSANLSSLLDVRLDGWALACAALLTLATALLFGLWPALQRGALTQTAFSIKATGGRATPQGRRRGLVLFQVALTTVLLIGAGLLLRSLAQLTARDTGFGSGGEVLTFQLDLSAARYAVPNTRVEFARRFEESLAATPGISAPSLWGPSQLANATWVVRVRPEERRGLDAQDFTMLFRHSVNPGALSRLGIPLRAGREFDAQDDADAPLVAVVSESVARQLWPGRDPVGQRLFRPDSSLPAITVVGVAGDAQHRHRYSLGDLSEGLPPGGTGPQRDVYFPYAQRPNPTQTWAVRLENGPASVDAALAAVRTAVRGLDVDVPLQNAALLADRLARQEGAPAAIAKLFGGFALFALLLAGLGVYGVVSQRVEHRMPEIGVRLALGAGRGAVVRLLVGHGALPVLAGTALGVGFGIGLGSVLRATLYGISAVDIVTFTLAPILLIAVALVSSYLPARRALGEEPFRALRSD